MVLLAAGTGACAPPSQYRYSAFVPAARPLAWDGRTEPEGTLRLEGAASNSNVYENLAPQLHDTALLVPTLTFEGSAAIALGSKVEVGLRGAWASYDSAVQTAAGAMPVPNAPPSWGAGPEVRLAFPLADGGRLKLGVAGSLMDMQVSYAEWQLTGSQATAGGSTFPCSPSPNCVAGYELHATATESHWVTTIAVVPSYAFGDHGEYGHAFFGLTATTGFQNDGFTNTATTGSTVNTFWPLWIASLGYGVPVDVFRFSAMLFLPLTGSGSPVSYGFGGMLTAGIAVPLWEASRR